MSRQNLSCTSTHAPEYYGESSREIQVCSSSQLHLSQPEWGQKKRYVGAAQSSRSVHLVCGGSMMRALL